MNQGTPVSAVQLDAVSLSDSNVEGCDVSVEVVGSPEETPKMRCERKHPEMLLTCQLFLNGRSDMHYICYGKVTRMQLQLVLTQFPSNQSSYI